MENFGDIIKSENPVLVDFFATWCGPCKMMHPILEELQGKVSGKARVVTIDIDQNEDLAESYRVQSVPTLMIFQGGEMKWRASGVHSAADLEKELEKYY